MGRNENEFRVNLIKRSLPQNSTHTVTGFYEVIYKPGTCSDEIYFLSPTLMVLNGLSSQCPPKLHYTGDGWAHYSNTRKEVIAKFNKSSQPGCYRQPSLSSMCYKCVTNHKVINPCVTAHVLMVVLYESQVNRRNSHIDHSAATAIGRVL